MIYGSVCSGIEAATVAWHPLGWKPAFFSEIDKFPRAVLAHHYPDVPLHGDFTTIEKGHYAAIDLLVGGTPCQAFSVAGLRQGFADERGNLTLEFLRLADRLRPQWIVWENVPGVLSIDGGRAFGAFLGGLAECGYGFAYRVLDAQYFGVPQRRRRVFVIGYLGDWRPAAAILFESESLRGDITPRREKGEAAPTIPSRRTAGGGLGTDFDCDGGLIQAEKWPVDVAPTLNAHFGDKMGLENQHALHGAGLFVPSLTHSLRGEGFDASEDGTGRGTLLVPVAFNGRQDPVHGAVTGALDRFQQTQCVAFAQNQLGEVRAGDVVNTINTNSNASGRNTPMIAAFKGGQGAKAGGIGYDERVAPTLNSADSGSNRVPAMLAGMQVRRLTPRECERLQGFPDDYTLIPHRGKPAADGPRYKALGNSMAVPVMRWIGERIEMVRALQRDIAA